MSELNVTAFAFLFHSSSKPSLIAEFSLRERVRKQEVFWKKQTCFYSSPTTLWKDGELPFPTELLGTTSVPACSGPSPPPGGYTPLREAVSYRLTPHMPHIPASPSTLSALLPRAPSAPPETRQGGTPPASGRAQEPGPATRPRARRLRALRPFPFPMAEP